MCSLNTVGQGKLEIEMAPFLAPDLVNTVMSQVRQNVLS
jgi:hypothetical protein